MAGVLSKDNAVESNRPDVLLSLPYCEGLEKFQDVEFGKVIVYLDDDLLSDLLEKHSLGKFGVYETSYLLPGTGLTDWDIGQGQYKNRWRTYVKPVVVRYDGIVYKEVPLFCRVRGMANPYVVRKIIRRLNSMLDKYKNHVRNGIAVEWCSQELWRIYPRFEKDCVKTVFAKDDDGSTKKSYQIPEFSLAPIMKDLLPEGYDDEWLT